MKAPENGSEITILFQTFLNKENGTWKVDYALTENTINANRPEIEILEELRGLAEELSKTTAETLSKLKQKIPEIEKKVKDFGEEASREVEIVLQQHLPKIKKNSEELGKSIENAWQQSLPEVRKNLEKLGQILEKIQKDHDKGEQEGGIQVNEEEKVTEHVFFSLQ